MYLLEPLVKRYTSEYKHLDQAQRRSFINHYVAASIKLILIIASVYPAISVISGHKNLQSPFAGSSTVKVGDVLLCTFQVFTAMYIFELFYREKVSYISGAHHIGAIIITQTAIVLFLDPKHQQDAELEFIMCLLWGELNVSVPRSDRHADAIKGSLILSQSSGLMPLSLCIVPGPRDI